MEHIVNFILSETILIPVIIGIIRFKTVKDEYLPFFCLLVIGFITEIISFVLIGKYHASNAVPTNIFVIVEWLLLSWQFQMWGLLKKRRGLFFVLTGLPVLVWIVENIVFGKIVVFSPFFRISYSFLLTLMSISEINYKITHDNKNLFRNPKFIICIGLILFFVYQILYEWAYQVSLYEAPGSFTNIIVALFAYIDGLSNIIFGTAFLVIPVRRHFKLE